MVFFSSGGSGADKSGSINPFPTDRTRPVDETYLSYDDIDRIITRRKFHAMFSNGQALVMVNDLRPIYPEQDLEVFLSIAGFGRALDCGMFSDNHVEFICQDIQAQLSSPSKADAFIQQFRQHVEIVWVDNPRTSSVESEAKTLIELIENAWIPVEEGALQGMRTLNNGPTKQQAAQIRQIMTDFKKAQTIAIRKLTELR